MDEEGYLDLSRQVFPVRLKGRLEILMKTFPQSGDISEQWGVAWHVVCEYHRAQCRCKRSSEKYMC